MGGGQLVGWAGLVTAIGTAVTAVVALRRSNRTEDRQDRTADRQVGVEEAKVGLAQFEAVTSGLQKLADEAVAAAGRAEARAAAAEERAHAAETEAADLRRGVEACHRERDQQGMEIASLRAEVAALRGGS